MICDPRGGYVALACLGEALFDVAAIGAGAIHRLGGRASGGDEPLGHALVLAHEGERGCVDLDGAACAHFSQVGGLHVGREPAGRGAERETLAVVAAPGRGIVRQDRGIEERLAQLQVRVVPLRQRDVEVCGEPVLAQETVERCVRRIDEVADVGDAVEPGVPGCDRERREEETPRFAHVRGAAAFGEPFALKAKVRPERFGDEAAERVEPLCGERRGKERGGD